VAGCGVIRKKVISIPLLILLLYSFNNENEWVWTCMGCVLSGKKVVSVINSMYTWSVLN
jgi:ABC-type spermidine/putrescine transport system permease subunit II